MQCKKHPLSSFHTTCNSLERHMSNHTLGQIWSNNLAVTIDLFQKTICQRHCVMIRDKVRGSDRCRVSSQVVCVCVCTVCVLCVCMCVCVYCVCTVCNVYVLCVCIMCVYCVRMCNVCNVCTHWQGQGPESG